MSQAPQEEAPKLDHAAPKWLKEYLESLRDFITRIQPIQGLGTSITQAPKGRAINANPGEGGSITADGTVGFQLVDASTEGQNKVRVILGTVKAGGTSWLPTGMTVGDDPSYVLDVGSDGYIVLIVTVDTDGIANSATIGDETTIPPDTATNGHLVLGTYGGESFAVTGAVGDQAYIHAGGEHHFFKP